MDCVNCMDNFFRQYDYFTIFIETVMWCHYRNSHVLSCGDYYVDIHQPLICVAHNTKTLCFARKYNALSIYVCGPTVARV